MKLTPDIYFTNVPPSLDMKIRSELFHTNEFTFAVAVILSAQATDKKVNEITPALFAVADTPNKMLLLGTEKLKEYIKQISFFNNKAKNIIGLATALENNPLPHNRDALMKLPGIGQKTANVIMNVLWGIPTIGVDTHIFRNAHRYGWTDKNTPEKVEKDLLKLIPEKYHSIVSNTMVLHGRYICTARNPKCFDCPVVKWCNAADKKL
ncbi:MAG: endonuclease III [Rickettsiales bacterium]|jgi:endonuclease-3|nr:endonuclease III [Rickettsiales bacterium]